MTVVYFTMKARYQSLDDEQSLILVCFLGF